MTEVQLWKIVCDNAKHISVMNREMGEIVSSIEWIKNILTWQFGCLAIIIGGIIVNIVLTKKNGGKK